MFFSLLKLNGVQEILTWRNTSIRELLRSDIGDSDGLAKDH